MKYWKKDLNEAPLSIDRAAAFEFIERGVYGGEATPETSRTLAERLHAVRLPP